MITAGKKQWETRFVQSVIKAIVKDISGDDNIDKCITVIAEGKSIGQMSNHTETIAYHAAKHNEGFWPTKEDFLDNVAKIKDLEPAVLDFYAAISEYYGIETKAAGEEKK